MGASVFCFRKECDTLLRNRMHRECKLLGLGSRENKGYTKAVTNRGERVNDVKDDTARNGRNSPHFPLF